MLTETPTTTGGVGRLAFAAAASLGAGAIHAAAIGVHGEHSQAVMAFTVVAAFQLGWGALALRRSNRAIALVGLVGNLLAVGGWLAAKTVGIGFVDGLGDAEAIQLADALAAGLAAAVVAGAATFLAGIGSAVPARLAGIGALAVAAIALPGMTAAGQHAHEGHDDGADTRVVAASDEQGEAVLASEGSDGHGDGGHGDEPTPTAKPYDPTMPIDLGGMDGVTPQQQAAAENLVSASLAGLPQFADPAVAEAAGYNSIGDGGTGYEHFINQSLVNDDKMLDPDFPESLVFRVENGERTLEAAMFMLREGDTLDDVPELGGDLTQWHIHDNLCYTPDPVAPRVGGLIRADGTCAPPLVPGKEVPMIHVWVVPNKCGPFAALEGLAAGSIAEDEERLCDEAHGAH